MREEVLFGLLLVIVGVVIFVRGLKQDKSAIGSLKYRMLLVGGAAIFFGLIMMLR